MSRRYKYKPKSYHDQYRKPAFYHRTKAKWVLEYETAEWKLRRLQILERDNHRCSKCGSPDNLQVHHTKYDSQLRVWEYVDEYLMTLCQTCHQAVHDSTDIKTFYSPVPLPKYDI